MPHLEVSPTMGTPLTTPLDLLVGRSEEIKRLETLFERARVVTITGPGGIGKTRVAAAFLHQRRPLVESAWFVDLTSTRDADLVFPAIAAVLEIDDRLLSEPLSAVLASIAGRRCLLVLDNLEQIRGVGSIVATLLNETPNLHILATSRMPLGAPGESILPLPPLEPPQTDEPADISGSPAGALFLERARATGRIPHLDPQTARDIAELVRRLDGIPLAIELAAARTRALTPGEVLRRLIERGASSIGHTRASHQTSLIAVLDWTLGILDVDTSQVLQAAAGCSGFDLDLIEAITHRDDALEGLETLVDLGLVSIDANPLADTRYRLLEVIDQETKRRVPAETRAQLAHQHAHAMAERAAEWYRAPGSRAREHAWRGDQDAGNYMAALTYLEANDPPAALSLWYQLEFFWRGRGRARKGAAHFERLRKLHAEPSVALARATAVYLGLLDAVHGPASIRAELDDALRLATEVGDAWSQVLILEGMLLARDQLGDHSGNRMVLEHLGRIHLDSSDPTYPLLLHAKAMAVGAIHGFRSDEVVAAFIAARDVAETGIDARNGLVTASLNLAQTYLYRRQFGEAATTAQAAIDASLRSGETRLAGYGFSVLAGALAELGRLPEAVQALRDSQDQAVDLDEPEWLNEHVLRAMVVAHRSGQPVLVARLWGASRALVESKQATVTPDDFLEAEQLLDDVRRMVGALAVEQAIADGRTGDPDALARAVPDLLATALRQRHRSSSEHRMPHGDLTRREIEVLRLVGSGKSDPQIGDVLFISAKTASVHVANVKSKLAVSSRLEIALKARELGLVGDGEAVLRRDDGSDPSPSTK